MKGHSLENIQMANTDTWESKISLIPIRLSDVNKQEVNLGKNIKGDS